MVFECPVEDSFAVVEEGHWLIDEVVVPLTRWEGWREELVVDFGWLVVAVDFGWLVAVVAVAAGFVAAAAVAAVVVAVVVAAVVVAELPASYGVAKASETRAFVERVVSEMQNCAWRGRLPAVAVEK